MDDQPGLEVVDSNPSEATFHSLLTPKACSTASNTAPETVPHELLGNHLLGPEVIQCLEENDKFYVEGTEKETNGVPKYLPYTPHTRRSRKQLLIWICILLSVIVASIVGGVIGSWRSSNNPPTPTSSLLILATPLPTSPSLSPTSTATRLHLPRSNSRLAVSGWRTKGNFFNFRIFYQDQSNHLRFLDYNSDGSGWGSSVEVNREGILSTTDVAACAIIWAPPQHELFFLNSSSQLTGNNFREGVTPLSGLYDSIDGWPILIHSQSRLATYWPYVVMQKQDLTLQLVNYQIGTIFWQNQSLGMTAPEGSDLAIVPKSSSYTHPYPAALVYQRENGSLALYSLNYNTTGSDWGVVTLDLPPTTSFGAFAVARENDTNNATDIYILYQTASNDLRHVHYCGNSWEFGPASDALRNADPSTAITCLTQAILYGDAALSTAYDMSRCYFMVGGKIKEVGFDGTTWTDMGYVPLT